MAYLVISKNRPISKLMEKMRKKWGKILKNTEVELHATSRAEILYFAWSLSTEHVFGSLMV